MLKIVGIMLLGVFTGYLKGLILALGGVSGSVILAWVVYRFFFMRRDESSVS